MGNSCGKDDFDDDPPPLYFSDSLHILDGVNMLKVQQNLPRDIKVCCRGNTYRIMDESGTLMFKAIEKPFCNVCCSRWWCGPARGFKMTIYDKNNQPLLNLDRAPCRCDFFCCADCFLCVNRMTIQDDQGNDLGKSRQVFSCCHPRIDLIDGNKETVGKIRGPCCPCRCCCDIKFNIFTPEGSGEPIDSNQDTISELDENSGHHFDQPFYQSGYIYKKWEAVPTTKANMDHENSIIRFPTDMDTVERALLLGGFFLVDFMFFEMS